MKKLLILSSLILVFAACKKEDNVSKVVDVTYPEITLKGDKYITIDVNGSYTDEGATVFDDVTGTSSDIEATYSSLDPSTPGLYYMQYTAKNANGYITSVARYIAVTDYADGVDLSGVYERSSNGVQVNLLRMSRGLYMTDDMGGANINDAGYFVVINDTTIDFGPQYSETIGTEIYAVNAALEIGPTDTAYTYALRAPGYGTGQRTFVKQ